MSQTFTTQSAITYSENSAQLAEFTISNRQRAAGTGKLVAQWLLNENGKLYCQWVVDR